MKIRKVTDLEEAKKLAALDPVRPYIDAAWRLDPFNEMYVMENDKGEVKACTCMSRCHDIPVEVKDMYEVTLPKSADRCNIAVFYTIWSYSAGAGVKLIQQIPQVIKDEYPLIKRFVTLSPLTPMATNFHMRNGARCIGINLTSQNFEYKI